MSRDQSWVECSLCAAQAGKHAEQHTRMLAYMYAMHVQQDSRVQNRVNAIVVVVNALLCV